MSTADYAHLVNFRKRVNKPKTNNEEQQRKKASIELDGGKLVNSLPSELDSIYLY